MQERDSHARVRTLWIGALIAVSAALTTFYTCITPFAAFAIIAATTLGRGQALGVTLAVWLANQAVGFGVLNYPWTGKTFVWGVAIGGAALLGTVAAQWTVGSLAPLWSPARALAGFASAFLVYQLALYVAAVSVLGGTGAFAPRIVAQVLLVNVAAFVGLFGLRQLVELGASVARRRTAEASQARIA